MLLFPWRLPRLLWVKNLRKTSLLQRTARLRESKANNSLKWAKTCLNLSTIWIRYKMTYPSWRVGQYHLPKSKIRNHQQSLYISTFKNSLCFFFFFSQETIAVYVRFIKKKWPYLLIVKCQEFFCWDFMDITVVVIPVLLQRTKKKLCHKLTRRLYQKCDNKRTQKLITAYLTLTFQSSSYLTLSSSIHLTHPSSTFVRVESPKFLVIFVKHCFSLKFPWQVHK